VAQTLLSVLLMLGTAGDDRTALTISETAVV
jgi:hypothetical protein